MAKNTYWSCRVLGFNSKNSGYKPSATITPVPGNVTPLSAEADTRHTRHIQDAYTGKILIKQQRKVSVVKQ